MNSITAAHTQDLDDLLAAARLCLCEIRSSTQAQMFRSMFGALFCESGSCFNDRLTAYEDHKREVPQVLAAAAGELERRQA